MTRGYQHTSFFIFIEICDVERVPQDGDVFDDVIVFSWS